MRVIKFRIPVTSFATGKFIKFEYITLSHGCSILSSIDIQSNDNIYQAEQQYVATSVRGFEMYEGDKVLVSGTKRVGEYETEIIYQDFGFKLKENKTYLTDWASLVAVKKVIGHIYENS